MALRYNALVRHSGLGKSRLISGSDQWIVQQKAAEQEAQWEVQWRREQRRETARRQTASKKELAERRTQDAADLIAQLSTILVSALADDHMIVRTSPKNLPVFDEAIPPKPTATHFVPELNFFDRLFLFGKWRKLANARERFTQAQVRWKRSVAEIEQERQRYLDRDPNAIAYYCNLVLSKSQYPRVFPRDFSVEYEPSSRVVVVECQLPSIDDMPRLKEVRYVQSRDDLKEINLSDKEVKRSYDNALYQKCLRTFHELFVADAINIINMIVFNGWVKFIDRATGKRITACVMSLQIDKDSFRALHLSDVDPKACFKGLKGVSATELADMAAVAPILQLNKTDRRFVPGVDIVDSLEKGANIAAIGWEEFEHLIREVFEKEFSLNGGEVKITRATADGGVDAIAFDPDPIRGGKIVIQAKRYTNPVSVSAVRDLFGTVMSEGANKGILVTTSGYGAAAYKFAKDKPITLLDGSNLLHLLEKHGHKARIDLKEAKKLGVALKR